MEGAAHRSNIDGGNYARKLGHRTHPLVIKKHQSCALMMEAATKEAPTMEATIVLGFMALGHIGVGFANIVIIRSLVGSIKLTSYCSTEPYLIV